MTHLADSGPGRRLLDTIPDGPSRDAAIADVRETLGRCHTHAGVQLGAGILVTTAYRPAPSGPYCPVVDDPPRRSVDR